MRHFLLSLLALLCVSTMATAAEAEVVSTVTLTQNETSTGVYDLSSYISNSSDNLTITAGGSYSITFTAVGTVGATATTATYTADSWSATTIPTLIAETTGWYIDDQAQESISWDGGAPTSLTLEGDGIVSVSVGENPISVGMSYPSVVDLSTTETAEPSVLALLQGTVTDPTTYELLDLTIVFISPTGHEDWSNVQVGGMYSGEWLCTEPLVTEEGEGSDQTAVITCEDLKAAFETALSTNENINDKTFDYLNFTTLQIQVNGTVIKSVSYTYGTPATEEPETSANVEYNFDDDVWVEWQAGADADSDNKYWPESYTDGEDANGLSFIKGSGNLYFQTNGASCMIGTDENNYPMVITPEYRFQLGGTGSLTANKEKCLLGVPVEGNCDIYVVAASGSSSGTDRYLKTSSTGSVAPEVGYEVPTSSADNNCLFKYTYTGDGETVYFYSSNSGINIFYIYVSYDGSEPEFTEAVVVEPEATEATWTLLGTHLCGEDEDLGVSGSSSLVEYTWESLTSYKYIAFDIIYGENAPTAWAPAKIVSDEDWTLVVELPDEPNAEGGENYISCTVVYEIETLKAMVDEVKGESTSFFFSGWNIEGINVYASADYVPEADTEDDDNQESSDDAVTVVVYEYESGDMLQAVTIFDSADTNPFATMTAAELVTVEFHVVTLTAYDSTAEDGVNNIGYSNFVFVGTDAVLNNYWMQAGNEWDVIGVPEDGSSDNYTSFAISYEDAIATMIDDNELSEDYSFADLTSLKAQLWNASYFVYIDYTYTKATSGAVEGGNDTDTAISNVNVEVTEVARYNLMGQKISGAEKGINIIVYSDGSAKKVLVK